jgi:hypothetical protein
MPRLACPGPATVRKEGTTLGLVFDDGSGLTYDPTLVDSPVAPPQVANGDTVWMQYSRNLVMVPYGGSYLNAELQIRKEQAGELLWVGRQGSKLEDVSDTLVAELFGVTARQELVCSSSFSADCYDVRRDVFDHVLETTPEQRLHHATLERVTTPKGSYEVVWAHSEESATRRPLCYDGAEAASDTGFAVSRLAP